jgi:hypothetical protein
MDRTGDALAKRCKTHVDQVVFEADPPADQPKTSVQAMTRGIEGGRRRGSRRYGSKRCAMGNLRPTPKAFEVTRSPGAA